MKYMVNYHFDTKQRILIRINSVFVLFSTFKSNKLTLDDYNVGLVDFFFLVGVCSLLDFLFMFREKDPYVAWSQIQ